MNKNSAHRTGMASALAAATLWGILPIYWKALLPIPSDIIIFYRIFFVGLTTVLIGFAVYGKKEMLMPLKDKKTVFKLFAAGFLITANWSVYIWAVNAGHIIQTSIGYYIEPLAVSVIGIVFFKEKLDKFKLIALFLAFFGVAILVASYRQVPGIALGLIFTFAIYAAIKKTILIKPLISLCYETVIFMPFALYAIVRFELKGLGAIGTAQPYQYVLLVLTGVITAVPLVLYGIAATRITLVSLGITEYIAPSLGLVFGVFLYGESFQLVEAAAFAVIWAGLAVFTLGEIAYSSRNMEKAPSDN